MPLVTISLPLQLWAAREPGLGVLLAQLSSGTMKQGAVKCLGNPKFEAPVAKQMSVLTSCFSVLPPVLPVSKEMEITSWLRAELGRC